MKSQRQQGFTLIELLLYITLAALFLLATAYAFIVLVEARTKNSLILNVDGQGNQAMHVITQQLRNADSVSSPTIGTNGSSLMLSDGGVSYVFDVLDGVLRVTEDADPPIALTNSQVNVSDFTVTNYSHLGTPGTIRIEFTVSDSSDNTRYPFTYVKDFIGSGSLHRN